MSAPADLGTVFLVDDDPSVLRALSRLVRSAGWNVAAYASAREFLERSPAGPGCVVLDVAMSGMDGLELQRQLAANGNELPIVFLTGHGDIPMSVRAMRSGAVDFLSKPCRDEDLIAAIRHALAIARSNQEAREERQGLAARFEALTAREHEVMTEVVAGRMNKEIAAALGIAEKTIKVHRARVMTKLGVRSVADLVRLVERWRSSPERPAP